MSIIIYKIIQNKKNKKLEEIDKHERVRNQILRDKTAKCEEQYAASRAKIKAFISDIDDLTEENNDAFIVDLLKKSKSSIEIIQSQIPGCSAVIYNNFDVDYLEAERGKLVARAERIFDVALKQSQSIMMKDNLVKTINLINYFISESLHDLARRPIFTKNAHIVNTRNDFISRLENLQLALLDEKEVSSDIEKIKLQMEDVGNILQESTKIINDELISIDEIMDQTFKDELDQFGSLLYRRRRQMVVFSDFGVPQKAKWLAYLKEEFFRANLGLNIETSDERFVAYIEAVDEALDEVEGSITADLKTMTPIEYEQHCASILEAAGWTCALTAASGDQGVDVIAEKNGVRIVFQCKLYSQPVGNSAVQEAIAGKIFEKADIAAVVSNATYTKSAKALASNADVLLLHHDELDNIDELIERMSIDKSG